ncbi:hypothetical protein C8Q76DRAFT_292843 [Earliella scabrosa]|nr:hypothetical protein C8Q76DRAFT_292843 [Earliella scabrosa]
MDTMPKSGTWTQTNMAEHPAENDRFLRRTENAIESSSASAVVPGRIHTRSSPGARYARRTHYIEGDRVIVCVCEDRLGTWRHGVVANLERYPVRYEGRGQYTYPVLYPSRNRTVMGYFNPTRYEMLYDEWLATLELGS